MDGNSATSVFRFLQLRGSRASNDGATALALQASSPLANKLVGLAPADRSTAAREFLERNRGRISAELASPRTAALLSSIDRTIKQGGSISDLRRGLTASGGGRGRRASRAGNAGRLQLISDALLASKFAPVLAARAVTQLRSIYTAESVMGRGGARQQRLALAKAADLPLELPVRLNRALRAMPAPSAGRGPGATKRVAKPAPAVPSGELAQRAARELTQLHVADLIARRAATPGLSKRSARALRAPSQLSRNAVRKVSPETSQVLAALRIDLSSAAIGEVIAGLDVWSQATPAPASAPMPSSPPSAPPLAAPEIRAIGIADLLVVKQHLKRYQRSDIAHVENVLTGERRSRTLRSLEHVEDVTTTERETTTQRESELQSTDRFEMNQETERTISRDQQYGFGLSISGKYGPAVEFSSNFDMQIGIQEQQSAHNAVTYAKDIVERSLERVTERVREEQVHRVIREQEETNLHDINNQTGAQIAGVYQFLEKVYHSQVFNYGLRQMFDFMVPEPASYLWHLQDQPGPALTLPQPPKSLDDYVVDARGIDASSYQMLAAIVSARGVEPPPTIFKRAMVSFKHGDTDDGSESGQPRSVQEKEVQVPEGYLPFYTLVNITALSDDTPTVAVTVGSEAQVWRPSGGESHDVGSGHKICQTDGDLVLIPYISPPAGFDLQSKLTLSIVAFETHSYSVAADIVFIRSDEAYAKWQIQTYDVLAAASAELKGKYDEQIAALQAKADTVAARAERSFGSAPSDNLKVIRTELKKHSISILTQQWYQTFGALVSSADPPRFDLQLAYDQGAFIRFFEQAFEWDQMQYVCYPYFWATQASWRERFQFSDVDPTFREFLQSGAARVVVPARPGFEEAISNYLDSLQLGASPVIQVPVYSAPYLPIVEEIKERTGAPLGEVAVGEPWETVVPTPLVILRDDSDLPRWKQPNAAKWEWEED